MMDTLPKGWTIAKLGEVGVCVTGNTPPKSNSQYYGNEIPFVKPPQINNGLISDASEYLSLEGGKKARVLPINSILITCIGNLGRVGINKFPIAFNQQINAVIPSDIYLPKLLFYQAQSLEFKTQLDSFSAATTVAIVNKGNFEKIRIPIPPLNEQKRILAKLEQLLTDLDKGIEYLETTKQQLKVYRESVLKWAFEGKLTNSDMNEEQLDGHANLITKGASPKWQGFNYINDSSQLLFITSENVRENYIDVSEPKYLNLGFNEIQKRSILRKDDVLFNLVGASIGRAAIFHLDQISNINQAVAIIRLKNSISNKYLSHYLNAEVAKQKYLDKVVDVARANLSLTDISNMYIPLPSDRTEQDRIVKEIESRLSVCDKIEETIESSLQQAEALRLSIIKKAFEGKLVPQDPNDEPAEKLLERIRAAKGKGKPEKKAPSGRQVNSKRNSIKPYSSIGASQK